MVTLVVQNGSVHRYYRFGQEKRKLVPEMADCIERRQTTVVPLAQGDQVLTVLLRYSTAWAMWSASWN